MYRFNFSSCLFCTDSLFLPFISPSDFKYIACLWQLEWVAWGELKTLAWRCSSPVFLQQPLESLSFTGVGKIRLCLLKSQLLVRWLWCSNFLNGSNSNQKVTLDYVKLWPWNPLIRQDMCFLTCELLRFMSALALVKARDLVPWTRMLVWCLWFSVLDL